MLEAIGALAALVTIFLGCFAFMYYLMAMFEKRLEGKFTHVEEKLDGLNTRLDEVIHEQADQRKRTDQLYQIVIDLLKSQIPKTNP